MSDNWISEKRYNTDQFMKGNGFSYVTICKGNEVKIIRYLNRFSLLRLTVETSLFKRNLGNGLEGTEILLMLDSPWTD